MNTPASDGAALGAVRDAAHVLRDDTDIDGIVDDIGDVDIVLLGEATHGTREFYRLRAAITRRLISEQGYDAVAVEADWPDALQVSRYVRAAREGNARTATEALHGFERFPQWMWRNTETETLVNWLRQHNERHAVDERIGFFGLDLYSLRRSMDAVVRYLAQVDPEAARQARASYACFDHLADDPQRYGYAANFGMRKDCEEEVVRQLVTLTGDSARLAAGDDPAAADELFYAQQNARVAANAEAYYRSMFQGRNTSWNMRDTHMDETLAALQAHLGQRLGRPARIVVWAHNSHIGDASATEMGDDGQHNLGQLVRRRMSRDRSFLLGFTTHTGMVTAASEWDGPAELKQVRPSHEQSFERLFHDTGLTRFFLPLHRAQAAREALRARRLERAIGVIYLPESERVSHYFEASMSEQFDAIVHCDETHALRPLERTALIQDHEAPETWPSGI